MRTGLPPKSAITGKNTGKNANICANWRSDSQRPSIHRGFWSKTTKPLSGKKISRTGKLRKNNREKIFDWPIWAFGPSHVTMHNRPSIIPEFPPPLSDGTNPIQAARLRPEENVFQSPISATNAVAPIGPIPGISAKAPARLTPAVKGHDGLVDGSAVAASHR